MKPTELCAACHAPKGTTPDCAFCKAPVGTPAFVPLPPPLLISDDGATHHKLAWGNAYADYLICSVCGIGWPPNASVVDLLRPCPGVRVTSGGGP